MYRLNQPTITEPLRSWKPSTWDKRGHGYFEKMKCLFTTSAELLRKFIAAKVFRFLARVRRRWHFFSVERNKRPGIDRNDGRQSTAMSQITGVYITCAWLSSKGNRSNNPLYFVFALCPEITIYIHFVLKSLSHGTFKPYGWMTQVYGWMTQCVYITSFLFHRV